MSVMPERYSKMQDLVRSFGYESGVAHVTLPDGATLQVDLELDLAELARREIEQAFERTPYRGTITLRDAHGWRMEVRCGVRRVQEQS